MLNLATISQDEINELIWGNFETKIVDMEIPLRIANESMRADATNGAYALFNGFLTFVMLKLGYRPKLPENFEVELEDRSWWVQNLDKSEFMGLDFIGEENYHIPPFVFKQFVNEIGKDITICILLDWFAFYECGLALQKSRLSNDVRYSDQLKDEFHLRSKKNFDIILKYMKDLRDGDFADMHKLVLRPDGLVHYLISLNEMNSDSDDFPEDVITNEQWEKWSFIEQFRIYVKSESVYCTEDNFKQLLEKASISIPNVVFEGFNQFLQDKLIPDTNEWSEIRDMYINLLANNIKEPYLNDNYDRAKDFLKKARKSLDSKNYVESVVFSSNAVEDALDTHLEKPKIRFGEKIALIQSDKNLQKYGTKLNYIRKLRNDTVHPNGDDMDETSAMHALELADQFIMDIQKKI